MAFEDYHITSSGNLGIDSSGSFEGVEGSARVAQAVTIRLNTALGEWKFKTTIGVDWVGVVLVKNSDITLIRAVLVLQTQDTPDVDRVTKMDLSILSGRLLSVTWSALTDDGIPIGGVI